MGKSDRVYQEYIQLLRDQQNAQQVDVLSTAFGALQHRINNTLNIINPNIGRLKKRIDVTDPEIANILDIIERNASYTSEIIARIQEPLKQTEQNKININSILADLCNKVYKQCQDQTAGDINLKFIQDLDDTIPLIQASLNHISEVLRNLMENSCRAMKYKGQLTISSRQSNAMIEVYVSDTGPGIPPSIQEKLFDNPVPSKEPGAGSGLGLWLSALILKPIGGKISIDKSDKTGTTMLIEIPIRTRGL
jgi:signal transduction histidine kinase